MLRHSFATRKIEGGMPAEVLKVIMGHSDIGVTLNTYTDVFSDYQNKYEQQTYNYYEEQGLTYEIENKDFLIKRELEGLLDKVQKCHLEIIDKDRLLVVINDYISKYLSKDENIEEENQIEDVNSNIIMFSSFAK